MKYIPPFQQIARHLGAGRALRDAPSDAQPDAIPGEIVRMIQALLVGVEVDEAWYLEQNEDVAEGIGVGKIISAKQHFLDHGYFEGRTPFRMEVDEAWYLARNTDVADHVRLGTYESGQAHFEAAGYREGRMPREL